jgi:hypothetical protein
VTGQIKEVGTSRRKPMHPYLSQAVAAERIRDARERAASARRIRRARHIPGHARDHARNHTTTHAMTYAVTHAFGQAVSHATGGRRLLRRA